MYNIKKKQTSGYKSKSQQSNDVLTFAEPVGTKPLYLFNSLDFCILSETGNRNLNPAHINKILKGLMRGEEYKLGTFIVDKETMTLIDGYHRIETVKKYWAAGGKLSMPFKVEYYERPEGQTLEQAIIDFNKDRLNWKAQDYIEVLAKGGDKYAIELAEFCNDRKFLHTESFSKKTGTKTIKPIMRYGGWFIKGINCSPLFKNGSYFHTEEELNRGKAAYDEIEKIFKAAKIEKTGTWFGEFVAAWLQVREENKQTIASLPKGFDSLIPEFEKGIYVNETTLVNQLSPNKVALQSVINSYITKAA